MQFNEYPDRYMWKIFRVDPLFHCGGAGVHLVSDLINNMAFRIFIRSAIDVKTKLHIHHQMLTHEIV